MSIFSGIGTRVASAFRLNGGGNNTFEAAGNGRRLRGFNPSRNHINVAIRAAGPNLIARARWLYENDGYAGNAIDEWTSHAVGDGIKPRPRLKKERKAQKAALLALFTKWTDEADAEGMTDYYGIQAKAAREAYMAGECFIRIRARRRSDMWTVPFQLQLLPAEMLDLAFTASLPGGNFIVAGIEFNAIGARVAYHFWRFHPHDIRPPMATASRDRVRVPAAEVLHVFDGRQGGQIRGVPRVARVLVKIFGLEVYDDAEIARKNNAALFTAFLIGRGENPITVNDDEGTEEYDAPIAGMEPGAIVDLGNDKDIKFSSPVEVGGSYEAFQYRTTLKISAGLGVPYSIVTGDMTKGNFSNVRTAIVAFRRRISQWQNHTLIHQLCRPIWIAFVERAVMAGLVDLPGYDVDPTEYWACDHLPPRQEWLDPAKDIAAEKDAIKGGLKSRTQSIAERGYDREDMDDEIEEERAEAAGRKMPLVFDTDGSVPAPSPAPGAPAPVEDNNPEDLQNAA
ncbi:phage portal protein [Mesorhizobium sp. NZP2234]|uniref:phage portal protein n=1 Tax=Mesorhizobium sp. NZP2234 TaxID=2483402 RepID=UPI001556C803|nr:phage portal protein [Mesorhizobium sp. NZP2234]QKC89993.1 phage portal protein [Mesorhizobium sp. NZP2234]